MLQIATIPRAIRGRIVTGSKPLQTCTSGQPAMIVADLYSKP
jgi:hypothetical protein